MNLRAALHCLPGSESSIFQSVVSQPFFLRDLFISQARRKLLGATSFAPAMAIL